MKGSLRGGQAARQQARPIAMLSPRATPPGVRLYFLVCLISGLSSGGTFSISLHFHGALVYLLCLANDK